MKLDDPEWQEQLVTLGQLVRPRLFIFDPLARMKAPARDRPKLPKGYEVVPPLRNRAERRAAARR